jgi:mRNA-degrading endonuclease toxin of MazEF toxin-antitoxin module
MKTSIKLFALGMILMGFGASAMAQVTSATANAVTSATIIAPLTIANTRALNFGNVATTGTAGTVQLSLIGAQNATGGVMLSPSNLGTHTSAVFHITGENNYAFSVTLPSEALTITESVSHNTMTVDTWNMDLSATGNHLSSGVATLTVAATLHVGASQASGLYTNNAGFPVTVAYE